MTCYVEHCQWRQNNSGDCYNCDCTSACQNRDSGETYTTSDHTDAIEKAKRYFRESFDSADEETICSLAETAMFLSGSTRKIEPRNTIECSDDLFPALLERTCGNCGYVTYHIVTKENWANLLAEPKFTCERCGRESELRIGI